MASARATRSELGAVVLLVATIALWGTAFLANDVGIEESSSMTFAALRAAPAALALLVALPLVGSRVPGPAAWPWAIAIGVLMFGVTIAGMSEGTARAGPGATAILVNTSPFFTLVLGRVLFAELTSPAAVGGLALGFVGVVVMVASQLGVAGDPTDVAIGIACALAAGLAWGVGTVLTKLLFLRRPETDTIGITAAAYVAGAAILVPLALGLDGLGGANWSSGRLWGAVAWIAFGSSALATLTFFLALRRIPATQAAAWSFLVPVVAVLIEVIRGNPPDATVAVGMVLAIIGVGIVSAPLARTVDVRLGDRPLEAERRD